MAAVLGRKNLSRAHVDNVTQRAAVSYDTYFIIASASDCIFDHHAADAALLLPLDDEMQFAVMYK